MENLPFLQGAQSDPDPPPREEEEWIRPPETFVARPGNDFLKNINPLTLLLVGIIVGVVLMNMRPIIIQKS